MSRRIQTTVSYLDKCEIKHAIQRNRGFKRDQAVAVFHVMSLLLKQWVFWQIQVLLIRTALFSVKSIALSNLNAGSSPPKLDHDAGCFHRHMFHRTHLPDKYMSRLTWVSTCAFEVIVPNRRGQMSIITYTQELDRNRYSVSPLLQWLEQKYNFVFDSNGNRERAELSTFNV